MGDVNVDNLTNNNDSIYLKEALEGYNLKRLKLPPTRITYHSQTSIDFICTNLCEDEISHSVIKTGLSDHTAQVFTVQIETQNDQSQSTRRAFSQSTMNQLRNILAVQDWVQVMGAADTESAFNAFSAVMKFAIDTACPLKTIKKQRNTIKRIWNSDCDTLKRIYLEALNKEIITGNPEDKRETALRKRAYDLKLKELRKENNSDLVTKADNKSKALWKVINSERKEKVTTSLPESISVEGEIYSTPDSIANSLNKFFSTIAEKTLYHSKNQHGNTTESDTQHPFDQKLQFSIATEEEVRNIINTMKPKTSAGEDEVTSIVIKFCKEEIIAPLTTLINKSLNEGVFPSCLKVAKVYPKHKSGKTTEAVNYRPISLTSNFSKILERVVLSRLTQHLQQHNLLTTRQHGFIKNRSTTTAVTQLVESIIDKLEHGQIATSILLDFSKAFDCIDHKLIVEKLNILGIAGKEAKWFKSYLSDRKQLVELTCKVNNRIQRVKSEALSMCRGVPQGSVLGPVLYILLANDFPKYLEEYCEAVMFADDTALIIANKKVEDLEVSAHIALNMAKQYCYKNDLVLNETKTNQLIFTTVPNNYCGLPELETVSSNKYLGIILDNTLSWTSHVDHLCQKLNCGLYAVRRIVQISDKATALTAYYSLFEAHLRYGLVVWGGTSATNLQRVLVIQKRAIRTLKGLKPQDSCREAFKDFKILTITSLYIREVIIYALKSDQARLVDQHNYNTRHRHKFQLQAHRLSLYEKKPSYRGAAFFNRLPEDLQKLQDKQFKKALSDWLLDRSIYTIQEFLDWRSL